MNMKLLSIVGHFLFRRDIKKVFLIEVEHKLQIDYQQTLQIIEKDNRIHLITIPIDIGENAFAIRCPLEHRGSVQQSFIHHPSMPTGT